jgi:hypothetical protein
MDNKTRMLCGAVAAAWVLVLASCSSGGSSYQDGGDTDAAPPDGTDTLFDPGTDFIPTGDADGDTIDDSLEGRSSNRDTDGDGTPDYLDLDSDDDTLPDSEEGLTDYDGDHIPSYVDTDSDGDGVPDIDEAAAGTDPYDPDSDDDGATDLIEIVAGTDPLDGTDNPHARGDFIFLVPYNEAPEPDQDTLVFATDIQMADVYFIIDTSASMGGEIANLRDTLSSSIVPEVRDTIPDVWFGVGIFDQCPFRDYCTSSGTPVNIENLQSLSGDASATQTALDSISGTTCNGANEPYIGSLWLLATGDTSRWPILDPRDCPDPAAPIGYPCFRTGAIPIIVQAGDEHFYNQSYRAGCEEFPLFDEMTAALNDIHAKFIGIGSSDSMWTSNGLQDTCVATGSVDIDGNPLAFRISSDGTGLGDQVIEAIQILATQVPMEIGTEAADLDDGPDDDVDATIFIDRIVPNEVGGVSDPEDPTVVCVGGLETADRDGDTVMDVFTRVLPGTAVCFDIYPLMNTTVPAEEEPRLFSAEIRVIGNGVTVLDTRVVYFLVPPDTFIVGPD